MGGKRKIQSEYDVVVCGAGPVGLLLANLLGQRAVRTLLIERNADIFDVPRAIAYDDETLRSCQAVGLYEEVEKGLAQDLPARFLGSDGRLLTKVKTFSRLLGHSPLGSFYQPDLERVLRDGLSRFPSVDVRFAHELIDFVQDGHCVRLTIRTATGREVQSDAGWLIGCDGGRSFVRSRLGITLKGSTYSEKWLVVDTEGDRLGEDGVTFYCDPSRPAVSVQHLDGRRRWEFLQMPGERDEDLLDDGKIYELLSQRLDPDGVTIERKALYTFHARIAERYREGRVLLAGDAAHLTPPFAGQGLNGGMRDASNLGWKLAAIVQQGAPAHLLESYQIERRDHMWSMIQLARRLGMIIMPTDPRRARIRDVVLGGGRRFGFTQQIEKNSDFLRTRPFLGGSPLVRGNRRSGASGYMLPQPQVENAEGECFLLDEVLGTSFALIGYGHNPLRFLRGRERAYLESMGSEFVEILPQGVPWPDVSVRGLTLVRERGDLLVKWLGARAGSALLVRPDRYIAAELSQTNASAVTQWLQGWIPGAADEAPLQEVAHG